VRHRGTHNDYQALLGPGAPAALLIADSSGTVTYRNPAAMALSDRVAAKRGEGIILAMRDRIGGVIRETASYPVTKVVSVDDRGHRADVELVIDRLADQFVVAWSDVTEREDGRRSLSEMSADLGHATLALARLGDQLGHDTNELSERADTVASSATEMTASIGEIGRSASAAATNTSSAVGAAQRVMERVNDLADSSAKIGAISQLITSIAQQTNLLALNATIEAARAGEVGRGFAVVANEVKELAGETSRATSDIAPMIANIQAASKAVSDAIGEIVSLIGQIESQQTTIASAVEEQGITSGEMSANINGVAASTQSVAAAVGQLRQTAEEVASKVEKVASRI
jgi:methyl-accepting chemotaxis protein